MFAEIKRHNHKCVQITFKRERFWEERKLAKILKNGFRKKELNEWVR